MKSPQPSSSKFSRKSRDRCDGRWGVREIAVFCSILAVASIPISAVVGAYNGGLEDFLAGLLISAMIVMIFGSISLATVALESFLSLLWSLGLRAVGLSKPAGRGVYDDWLDGPA